ncbi:MAG: hypothetical protein K2Q14_06525 [Gammaproteobacteria bacterium]|nr:hypothetical protein [Gammaproteobacteria bacterium]
MAVPAFSVATPIAAIKALPPSEHRFLYVYDETDKKLYFVDRRKEEYDSIDISDDFIMQLRHCFDNACQFISEQDEYTLKTFTISGFTPPIALTHNEINTLRSVTGKLHLAFEAYNNYKQGNNEGFLYVLNRLIEATDASSRRILGPSVEDSTVFAPENAQKVKEFYNFWKKLSPALKNKYGQYR